MLRQRMHADKKDTHQIEDVPKKRRSRVWPKNQERQTYRSTHHLHDIEIRVLSHLSILVQFDTLDHNHLGSLMTVRS